MMQEAKLPWRALRSIRRHVDDRRLGIPNEKEKGDENFVKYTIEGAGGGQK